MKLAQQRRLTIRRHRALTRFSIIEVQEDDSTERRRYIVILVLMTAAVLAAALNLMT